VNDAAEKSLYLTYTGGEVCATDATKTHDAEIRLVCDAKATADTVESVDITDPCKTVITMKTQHGCPKLSSTAIVAFMTAHPWIIGTVLIVFGAIVCFFGRKFLQWTLAAIGFLLAAGGSMLLFSFMGLMDGLLTEGDSPVWLSIIAMIVSIALGVLAGWLMFKTWMVGACILGTTAGVFGMIALYNLLFFSVESFWLLLAMIIIGGVAGALLTYKFFDMFAIISTSLIGAYALVRGVSTFAGGFPNEMTLMDQLANDVMPHMDNYFYAYIAAIIALFIFGVIFQRKTKAKEDVNDGNYGKVQ
jgi:uncharacterized membrane protein HdeD (DUF308 family)